MKKNQNYSKIHDCDNKETFPETFTQDFEGEIKKNVVISSNKTEHLIPSTADIIIKASNYRVTLTDYFVLPPLL